jgi:AAA+ superfamily predicted ATPase
MVVLATTNHPEKLDAAILERPSRFDRKYHFSLPAQSERLSYVEKWNADLQSELRVSSETASVLVEKTEGFSFAYLKELFVASVTQWIASGEKRCIDEVVFEQLDFLRGQLKADTQKQERKAG